MKNQSNKVDLAKTTFSKGFNCCQSVFLPYALEQGLDEATSLKMSSAFAGGLCFRGETCGVVIGAHLVFGLLNGYSKPDDQQGRDKVKSQVADYSERFLAKNGSLHCKELVGANPAVPEELASLREQGVFKEKCPGFVKDSVEIIQGILALD